MERGQGEVDELRARRVFAGAQTTEGREAASDFSCANRIGTPAQSGCHAVKFIDPHSHVHGCWHRNTVTSCLRTRNRLNVPLPVDIGEDLPLL